MPEMLDVSGVGTDVVPLLRPVGNTASHDFRVGKARNILPGSGQMADFFSRDAVLDTFDGTQFDGENHRRITPWLQQAFATSREAMMGYVDGQAASSSRDVRLGYFNNFDVIIVGSGPHGAAVASYLRERKPTANILIVDSGKLGGQFRAYGPKPAFMMNSRVRKADRRLPALPRTAGSINPLGQYAPLELSDVAVGQYAMNTDMGDVCAINAFLSATTMLIGANVTEISNLPSGKQLVATCVDESGNEVTLRLSARFVVTAVGLRQRSALRPSGFETFPTFETAKVYGRYFDTAGFYSHMANSPMPLKAFGGKSITLYGAGDSALTAIEALVGALPAQTYGTAGVGRHLPASIRWVGAPRDTARAIERCLRSRYKNGVVQALHREGQDNGLVYPEPRKRGVSIAMVPGGIEVRENVGNKRYPVSTVQTTDIVIDCTNGPIPDQTIRTDWNPSFLVGPAARPPLPFNVRQAVEALKVKENTASLWATMSNTDLVSRRLAGSL